MKAEWIHTDDGLTLSVTAQSDADRVNFTAFYRGKPVKPLLRVTKTIKDSNGDYSGLQVAFIQPIAKKILEPLEYTFFAQAVKFRAWKLYGRNLVMLFDSGVATVKKMIFNSHSEAESYLDEVILAIKENPNTEMYDGYPVYYVGKCRSLGGLRKLIGYKNI